MIGCSCNPKTMVISQSQAVLYKAPSFSGWTRKQSNVWSNVFSTLVYAYGVHFIWHCLQVESIMYLTSWSRVLVEKVRALRLVMRSGAAHWHHLPKMHLNIICVCVFTYVFQMVRMTNMNNFICTYIYISPMKYASSQLVYFIITYYFLLLVLAHLSHHEGEPSTRENIIHVYVKI